MEGGPEKTNYPHSELAKKIFAKFETRSDDPGEFLSPEEKIKLQDATRTDPEALKKWEEDVHSKYRVNSLSAPLLASEIFLASPEAKEIPSDIKDGLIKKVKEATKDLANSRGKKISKELVDEVEGIMNEVKKYLK